jgi:hypothetical protein
VEVWRCEGVKVWRCGGVEVWRCVWLGLDAVHTWRWNELYAKVLPGVKGNGALSSGVKGGAVIGIARPPLRAQLAWVRQAAAYLSGAIISEVRISRGAWDTARQIRRLAIEPRAAHRSVLRTPPACRGSCR